MKKILLILLLAVPLSAAEKAKGVRVGLGFYHDKTITISAEHGLLVNGAEVSSAVFVVADVKLSALKPIRIEPRWSGDLLTVQGKKRYHGTLELRNTTKGVVLINHVPMNEYLYGVLPYEASCDWPMESLKVQAVISRTYAIRNLGNNESLGFDVTNDIMSQVYGGANAEKPACREAVDETGQEVILQNGKPADVYFHGLCGGHTEAISNVWLSVRKGPDHLKGVRDRFCRSAPRFSWMAVYEEKTLRAKLLKEKKLKKDAEIVSLKPLEKTRSGRYRRIQVKTKAETSLMPAGAFRMAVGSDSLRSTLWTRVHKKNDRFIFEGRGWGHGVGLCQWGAYYQAKEGRSYKKILTFYLPGTDIEAIR